MAEIIVRDFAFRVPPRGPVEIDDVTLVTGTRPLELNMARAMFTNALAIPYRGPLLMRLVERELALVLSMFHHTPPGVALTRHLAFTSSSLHIRRFTTEVMALGVLNALVLERFGEATIAHYDVLPPALQGTYPTGTRPDLRFAQGSQVLAGESRGRAGRPPMQVAFYSDQLRRLNELVTWSRHPACDPVCMAWSWMEDNALVVDFFTEWAPPPGDKVFGVETPTREEFHATFGVRETPERLGQPLDLRRAASQQSDKASRIAQRKRERQKELLDSAPDVPVPGMPDEWRGEWIDVPYLDGGPPARLLLAASSQAAGKKFRTGEQDKLSSGGRDTQLEVSTDGQLLCAIDWNARPTPEAGELLGRLVESLEPDFD